MKSQAASFDSLYATASSGCLLLPEDIAVDIGFEKDKIYRTRGTMQSGLFPLQALSSQVVSQHKS